jgi:hypothetical protein
MSSATIRVNAGEKSRRYATVMAHAAKRPDNGSELRADDARERGNHIGGRSFMRHGSRGE